MGLRVLGIELRNTFFADLVVSWKWVVSNLTIKDLT